MNRSPLLVLVLLALLVGVVAASFVVRDRRAAAAHRQLSVLLVARELPEPSGDYLDRLLERAHEAAFGEHYRIGPPGLAGFDQEAYVRDVFRRMSEEAGMDGHAVLAERLAEMGARLVIDPVR